MLNSKEDEVLVSFSLPSSGIGLKHKNTERLLDHGLAYWTLARRDLESSFEVFEKKIHSVNHCGLLNPPPLVVKDY